jgi:cell division protein FtsB
MRRAVRHRVGMAVAALALVGVLFLAVFPTQAYLGQRRERDQLAAQVAALGAANDALRQRAAELDTTEEIERLARLHYHLVRPGEEAYVILPDGTPPATTPPAPPAAAPAEDSDADADHGVLHRAWGWLSSLF